MPKGKAAGIGPLFLFYPVISLICPFLIPAKNQELSRTAFSFPDTSKSSIPTAFYL